MATSEALGATRALRVNFVVTFLGFLDTHILIPVMALYAADLGASVAVVGLVIGAYSMTNTPANVFFGRLVDKYGHRIPLMSGLVGDALTMLLYGVCRTPLHLGLVRALHGLSGGLVGPATMSATARYTALLERGRGMGSYGMAIALATLVGYGLGGLIASRLGYGLLFYFGGAFLLLGAFLAYLMPGDGASAGRAAKQLAGERPVSIGALVRRRGLLTSYCCILAQYFSFGGVVALLPLHVRGLGMGALHVGILLAVFAVVFALLQFPSGVLSDRVGRKLPAIGGLCLGAAAIGVLPQFEAFPAMAVTMGMYGVAYALLFPAVGAMVTDHTGAGERGMATGLFHALLTAGVALGAPAIGWVGGATSVKLGLSLGAAALALAALVVVVLLRGSGSPRAD